ncbi:uncharacterized protein TOT_010000958 [Theileria orientalis strain Shintoku]|uniref:Transcription factor 25 n=1 Tax=Theileria orientalis strain Shintoku TaxID=869250 RepID=J4C7R6_THEOR|nr:uncharacterized protein TOT_010000958 [Theileria orientalis strain Shintoku]BAM39503.1 uncharacterized protein TOT_010000958 [Theileria orientalis strain Shintoku]|eukprot:XP_009689804.1 uncharacterized protein TOT_010000958 [Theileria orientalis strain Shintoku]
MSTRQIKRLQRIAKGDESDTSEEETPQKLTPYANKPKYSFNLLAEDSDSDQSSSADEEQVNGVEDHEKPQDSTPKSKEEVSDESDWEKLLNEIQDQTSVTDEQANMVYDHFLSSPMHYFKTKDQMEKGKTKYSKKSSFQSPSRYWLAPGLSTREYMQLRTVSSTQMEVEVKPDPHTGRDKFELSLTRLDTRRYREIDDICSSAVQSHDFELFRSLLRAHPCHLGLLIRGSCINTISSNHQEAFTHLDMAVKILQTVLPHSFSIYRKNKANMPNVWLPSESGDNKLVYRLLLLYMISLERKGQWQTSLAICKLLMAMDTPEDAAHALLHVDMYLLNCFVEKRSISTFVYNYHELVNRTLPPLFWFLPNFALTLPLQLFLDLTKPVDNLMDQYEVLRDFLIEHMELIDCMGKYAPYMFLLRALIQYPLFIVKMAERTGSSPELRACLSEYPFNKAKLLENEDYDRMDYQLIRCYTHKCGDLWSGSNATFLATTATLLAEMYQDGDVRDVIDAFEDLWTEYAEEIELPETLKSVSVTEFDLANYSLPADLEPPI